MLTAIANRAPASCSTRRTIPTWLVLAFVAVALMPRAARAEEATDPGLTIQIPAAITADTTTRLRTALYGPVKHYEADRKKDGKKPGGFKVLFDFNPDGRPNASDDFYACEKLADYLRDLQKSGVKTRAYVHGEVSRHAVLPLLACGEIVMSPDPAARFGRITDGAKALDEKQRTAYAVTAQGHFPLALVHKMHDKDLVVVNAFPRDKNGDSFRDLKDVTEAKLHFDPVPDLGRDAIADYTFAQIRDQKLNLCLPDARNSLTEAMEAFKLPRSSLFPLLDHTTACLVKATGPVNGQMVEELERSVRRALGEKANVLIVQLSCGDGDDAAAYDLALFLADLNKERADEPVKTIAFVTKDARNLAAFLAFACDQIVLEKDAHLGDFDRYLQDHPNRAETIRKNLRDIAERQQYPTVLAEGLANRDASIRKADSTKGEKETRFLTQAEIDADAKSPNPRGWSSKGEVKPAGAYLTLSADDAKKYGVTQVVVSGYDELCQLEGVSPKEVKEVESDWLSALAGFLADPITSVILVMIGVICLILELKMPGASLPGVIGAVCFVLFFWSHSQLNGQITWLAVLLFILGLVLIGVEVFVMPGVGVCGISGVILVVGSIGLVAYGHWPQTNEEWLNYGQKLGPFGVGILVSVGAAFLLARYLPHIPFINRLILKPRGETEEDGEDAPGGDASQPELASLLGAVGVAVTPLRPAGKVQFGEEFIDVVAEGGYIVPGTRVQVIEIEGNRVVVKEV